MSIVNTALNVHVTQIVTRAMSAAGSTAAIDSKIAARIADDIAKLPLADQVDAWRQVDEFTHVSARRPTMPTVGPITVQVLPMGTPDDAAVSLFQTASAEAAKQLRQNNPGIEPDMIQGAFVSPPAVADVPFDVVGARIWGDGTIRIVLDQGRLVPKETLPGVRLDPFFPVSTATAPSSAPFPTPQPAPPAQPAQPAPAPQVVSLSGDILTLQVNGTNLAERLTGAMKTNGPMTLLEVRALVLSLGGPSVSALATPLISALVNSGQLVSEGPLWRAA